MSNLTLVALLVLALWVTVFALYFFLNRRQKDLEAEINSVRALLDEDEPEISR